MCCSFKSSYSYSYSSSSYSYYSSSSYSYSSSSYSYSSYSYSYSYSSSSYYHSSSSSNFHLCSSSPSSANFHLCSSSSSSIYRTSSTLNSCYSPSIQYYTHNFVYHANRSYSVIVASCIESLHTWSRE
jgi:hypothetical protein